MFGQDVHHRAATRITNPLTERFQHRVVGFLTSETLDTLSANHSQIRPAGSCLMKLINEGGLSNSRLSRDEDHLPLGFEGLAQIAVQLGHSGLATDHFLSGIIARLCGRPSIHVTHRGHELISPPWKRFNEFGFVATIA